MTVQRNNIHAFDLGLNYSGEDNHMSKITNKQAICVCEELVKNELTMNEISEKLNVSKRTVEHIKNRESWKRISAGYDFSHYNKLGKHVKKPVPQPLITTKQIKI